MEKVKVNVAKTPDGYCATVDLIDGFIVGVKGTVIDLQRELTESINFYVNCAKIDNEKYPAVFDGDYEFEYKFTIESLLYFYKKIIVNRLKFKVGKYLS